MKYELEAIKMLATRPSFSFYEQKGKSNGRKSSKKSLPSCVFWLPPTESASEVSLNTHWRSCWLARFHYCTKVNGIFHPNHVVQQVESGAAGHRTTKLTLWLLSLLQKWNMWTEHEITVTTNFMKMWKSSAAERAPSRAITSRFPPGLL